MRTLPAILAALLTTTALAQPTAPATQPTSPVQLLAALRIGSPADDSLAHAAFAPDGTLYIAGNAAEPPALPDASPTHGTPDRNSAYRHAFIATVHPDGSRLSRAATFAPGLVQITTVLPTRTHVYVAGYATPALAPLLKAKPALHPTPPTTPTQGKHFTPSEHHDEPSIAPNTDQRGAPFVARLSPDLTTLEAATFLEGYQSLWHVPRPLLEDHYQPVPLALLSDGDLVVAHDGGYNVNVKPGDKPTLESFYTAPDYLSRLSPDLAKRRWKTTILSPEVDPARAAKGIKADQWPHPTMGNTRIFRLRADTQDNLYISGWSASRTVNEPWWSPFLRKYAPQGTLTWKAWEVDPTSGDGRMHGQVSDAFVRSVALDDNNFILTSQIGDGGNNILRWDPRDYRQPARNLRGTVTNFPGRVLFWGAVSRLDPNSRELLAGNHFSASGPTTSRRGSRIQLHPVWANDLSAVPSGRILAAGRCTPWFTSSDTPLLPPPQRKVEPSRTPSTDAFLRLFSADFTPIYTSTIPEADLHTIARHNDRIAIVGTARNALTPHTHRLTPADSKADAYLLLLKIPPTTP